MLSTARESHVQTWGVAPIIRPAVARACAPSLTRIVAALDDEQVEIGLQPTRRLSEFLMDGVTSPLYGYSPTAAAREAHGLAAAFEMAPRRQAA